MDKLYLPYVKSSDKIETALEKLRQTDSRAIIICHEPNIHRLYMNSDIVGAWKENLTYCHQLPVTKGEAVTLLTTETNIHQEQMALSVNSLEEEEASLRQAEDEITLPEFDLEQELDQNDNQYGILKVPEDEEIESNVLVITRHETLKDLILYASKACVCDGLSRHTTQGSPPNTGDTCFCGHPYVCY